MLITNRKVSRKKNQSSLIINDSSTNLRGSPRLSRRRGIAPPRSGDALQLKHNTREHE
jgi:hypothetical protein